MPGDYYDLPGEARGTCEDCTFGVDGLLARCHGCPLMSDTYHRPGDELRPRRTRPYGEINGRNPIRQSPRHYPASATHMAWKREPMADRLREWRQPRKAERRRAAKDILSQLELA